MAGWTKHQKHSQPVPKMQFGHGVAVEDPAEPGSDFTLDKSGLLLPEGVARERRKVKTGFQPPEED